MRGFADLGAPDAGLALGVFSEHLVIRAVRLLARLVRRFGHATSAEPTQVINQRGHL